MLTELPFHTSYFTSLKSRTFANPAIPCRKRQGISQLPTASIHILRHHPLRIYLLPIMMQTGISSMQTRYTYCLEPKLILGGCAARRVPCLHMYAVVPNFSTGSNLLAASLGRLKVAVLSSGAGESFGTRMTAWNARSYFCFTSLDLYDNNCLFRFHLTVCFCILALALFVVLYRCSSVCTLLVRT